MPKIKDIKDMNPNVHTIELLESMLKDAKAGELRTVIAVCGWDDDCWGHSWVIDHRNTCRAMIGEMAMTSYDLATKVSLDDGDTVISRAFDE